MVRLVHLNGPPGIGKSTLSALYADRNPGTLNLDVDVVHHLVGGWQDDEYDAWKVVWPLVWAMGETHLRAGHDVVLPQYHARLDEIATLQRLADEQGAEFHEVVLLDDRQAALERFDRRARDDDQPWVRHNHRLVRSRGGPVLLETMYDDLLEVVRRLPGALVVRSRSGAVEETLGSFHSIPGIRVSIVGSIWTSPAACSGHSAANRSANQPRIEQPTST